MDCINPNAVKAICPEIDASLASSIRNPEKASMAANSDGKHQQLGQDEYAQRKYDHKRRDDTYSGSSLALYGSNDHHLIHISKLSSQDIFRAQ